jgi:AraC-like DNA-binding protein
MKLEQNIYPYYPELENLPVVLKGIGGSSWQSRIERDEGYMWHQILHCAGGKGMLEYEGKSVELPAGSFVFLPKDAPHKYYPLTDMWDVRWVAFDGRGCEETLALLGMDRILTAFNYDADEMEHLFDKMAGSLKTDVIYSGFTCSGLVYEYVLGFRRLITTEADKIKSRQLSVLMPALRYIYENYAEDISMAFLAGLSGITPQHMCRLFRSALNMRPNEYLLERRIEVAKKLLGENTFSVAETAEKCGFRDAGYFITVFRRKTGISPGAFRRKNAAEQ